MRMWLCGLIDGGKPNGGTAETAKLRTAERAETPADAGDAEGRSLALTPPLAGLFLKMMNGLGTHELPEAVPISKSRLVAGRTFKVFSVYCVRTRVSAAGFCALCVPEFRRLQFRSFAVLVFCVFGVPEFRRWHFGSVHYGNSPRP